MSWILEERRERRSADRETALRFQLESVKNRGNIEALVLADADGLLLAGAGEPAICEELGALAPLVARSAMGMPLGPLLEGGDVAVRPVSIHGQELVLASLGGGVARDALLTTSSEGIRRILAAN